VNEVVSRPPPKKPRPLLTVMARALGLLSLREHSRKELERKLLRPTKSGPVDRDEVQRVLDNLAARGLQSDERAALGFVESKGRKLGSRRLQTELQKRGVDACVAKEALAQHNDEEACAAAWRKKFGELAADIKGKQKQLRFLATRGFGMDTIRKVLGSVEFDDDAG
jgi:regulatory protein